MMRDKKGIHNSYNSPDSINTIDWRNKTIHHDVFDYVRELITLRKITRLFEWEMPIKYANTWNSCL